ncbi:MAG: archaea-specific SMC-related protein [Haloplanus sp.]
MPQHTDATPATVAVENIGGIDACEIRFEPGVTVLTGQNATNRTSLLRAVAGVFGGTAATLKSDADEGFVRLEYDETYTRRYVRGADGAVHTEGAQYADAPVLVDCFACLLEDNPARRAVERGDDLRELLMRPVDTEHIRARIREFERERRQVTDRLEEIEAERERLPAVESRRTSLEAELETVTADLETLRGQVADAVDATGADGAETLLTELDSRRQSLAQTRDEIETQRSTLETLREERTAVTEELDGVDGPDEEKASLERRLDELQDRKSELRDSINDLSAIVEFNQDLLDSTETAEENGAVADELDPNAATVTCWTCGSRVERRAIESQLDELRRVVEAKRTERRELEAEIRDRQERLDDVRSARTRRTELEDRRDEIDRQVKRRERRLETLEGDAATLRETIADLEREMADAEGVRESESMERYERLSELEYERGRIRQELTDVEDDVERLESLGEERDRLEARRTGLRTELESLRTRVETLERDAVEAFNEHMAELLARLEYRNVERVWIERTTSSEDGGAFELHVVRTTEDQTAYRDTVDHLSESEREVIGLVVALAGYLVHNVYETVPVMLVDSLEAIDATRIGRLLEYLSEFAVFLVVALLVEDAEKLDGAHTRVSAERIGS